MPTVDLRLITYEYQKIEYLYMRLKKNIYFENSLTHHINIIIIFVLKYNLICSNITIFQ